MTTAVTAYVCDFCTRKKRFASKGTATRHERQCYYNPARRACATCRHFGSEPYEPDTGAGGVWCEFGLIPVPATAEAPERRFLNECSQWEVRPVVDKIKGLAGEDLT